jgi:hypothetical protein
LKKFLERHVKEFLLGADHPFNPHVYLRALLTPEQAKSIERSPTPLLHNQGGVLSAAPHSSGGSGRRRRGGRRGKSAAAAAAAAAASAATAAVAIAPLHTLGAPGGSNAVNIQFNPGFLSRGGPTMSTTPTSNHSGSLGSSCLEQDDSASRASDSSSAGGAAGAGFMTPPPPLGMDTFNWNVSPWAAAGGAIGQQPHVQGAPSQVYAGSWGEFEW